MASPLGFLLPQPRLSPASALAAGQLSWVYLVCIPTPLSLEIHFWAMYLAMQIASKEHCRPRTLGTTHIL